MTREELAQDLSYVRDLAEAGRHAPLLGGSFLTFWGVLNLIAYTTHWSMLQGFIPGAGPGFGVLWATYGVIAGFGMWILGGRLREKPGRSSIGVRAERAIWSGIGFALFAVIIGCLGRMIFQAKSDAPNMIMGAAFALFGAALTAISRMAREKWLFAFALISYATGLLLLIYANEPWAYLASAAASAIVLITPGVILLKREPSTLV